MIYLSQLILNPTSRMVQSEQKNPYKMHQTLMRGFISPRENSNVLHRLDINPYSGVMALLVQSTGEPDWKPLIEAGQGQYLLSPPVCKAVDLALPNGRILQFRLTANPTVKKKREGKHSNRVPLVREETQIAWLQRKADQHGFHLLGVSVSNQSKQNGRKRRGQPAMTLVSVQFDGRLQITNADKFQEALRQGIGPAKAFGCGLLSLAPG